LTSSGGGGDRTRLRFASAAANWPAGDGAVEVADGVRGDGGYPRAWQQDAGQVQRVGSRDPDQLAGPGLLADQAEHVECVRVGELLAAEASDEPAAPDGASGLHPPERPEQVAPAD